MAEGPKIRPSLLRSATIKPHLNIGTIGHIDHGKRRTFDGGDHQGLLSKQTERLGLPGFD